MDLRAALAVACLASMVLGDGMIHLRFEEYRNPGGKGANGECCDGKWGICEAHGCDHMFAICLDSARGSDEMGQCQYGEKISDKINNKDTIVFGADINGVANPMQFPVTGAVPSTLKLKVNVNDKDSGTVYGGANDFVEKLTGTVNVSPANSGKPVQTLQGRTTLTFKMWANCSAHWYKSDCSVHCPAPRQGQNYRCDTSTGAKNCNSGWTGRDCSEQVTTPRPGSTKKTTVKPAVVGNRTVSKGSKKSKGTGYRTQATGHCILLAIPVMVVLRLLFGA